MPDTIRYYSPPGAIGDFDLILKACRESASPAEVYQRGFFSFATPEEIARVFADVGPFEIQSEYKLLDFIDCGGKSPDMEPRVAKNLMFTMFRRAWENFCRSKGLYEHLFAAQTAFHIGEAQTPLGKRIPWGQKDKRRSSMLEQRRGQGLAIRGIGNTCFLAGSAFQAERPRVVRRILVRQGRCRHRRHRNTASFTADDLQGLAQ